MNTTQTLQQLQQLKLQGMASSYRSQLELPIHQQLEAHELIAQLTQAELLTLSPWFVSTRTTFLHLVCGDTNQG